MASSNLGCVGTHGDAAMIYSPTSISPPPNNPTTPGRWEVLTPPNNLPPNPPPSAIACSITDPPPADSPMIVTLRGSPPNLATWSCTHSSASFWSRRPALRTPRRWTSGEARKPKAPSCWRQPPRMKEEAGGEGYTRYCTSMITIPSDPPPCKKEVISVPAPPRL